MRIRSARAAIVTLFPLLSACGGASPKDLSVKAPNDRPGTEELTSDLAKLRQSSIASMCSESVLRASKRQKTEVWGKEYAAPGLAAEQVEAFLCRQRPALANTCWDQKYSNWELSEIEYGLVVDPSGAVLGGGSRDLDGSVIATLERGSTRVNSIELARCVETVVDSWRFPRAMMPTWMRLSFRLPR
jgi:hypothetical protein